MKSGQKILFTGPPRCGKSTLIQRIIDRIQRPMVGFFTGEIRERGQRVGFSITTLDGREGVLAHRDFKGRFRVGKYGVNIQDLEEIAVPAMIPTTRAQVVVVDEIGKMECFSSLFRQTLIHVLDSTNDTLGSISLKGHHFIRQIKKRSDITLIHVSEGNRDMLVDISRTFQPTP